MDCPGCNVEMADLEGDNTALKKCSQCGGLWMDVADLNRLLLHNNLPGLESLGGRVNAEALAGQCPECHVDLVVIEGGDRTRIQRYETCESCGGILIESEFKEISDMHAALAEIVSFFKRFGDRRKSAAG
jgi:Zn-finger nucleic acid-binding protein